jgi:hypothetical protein
VSLRRQLRTIIFSKQKYGFLEAYKNIKNHGLSFVFAQKNAAHCISGQNKWLEAERLQCSLVNASLLFRV